MRLCIDTNAFVDTIRGHGNLDRWMASADELVVPYIVDADIRAGAMQARDPADELQLYLDFLEACRPTVLFPDGRTTEAWARIWIRLRAAGMPLADNDLWIPALCVQHGLVLLSRDRHFERLPDVPRISWEI